MTPAFIALGSNMGDPLAQLRRAVEHLRALPRCSLETLSGIYRSVPLGPADQPHYLNAVVGINCTLEPLALLAQLQRIETLQGRERSQRWGPRTLDLDLLLFGDLVMTTPQLTLPHPQMHLRNFVLYPLREVCGANMQLPNGSDLATLLTTCPADGLVKTEHSLAG